MKITKFTHSCLLIEEQEKNILIDPGEFSIKEYSESLSQLKQLNYLLITHEHSDHFILNFVKDTVIKFPSVKIITNPALSSLLHTEGIITSASDNFIQGEDTAHEKLFDTTAPSNYLFHIANTLTHPGDSLQFTKTNPVLALPITAPWGSLTQAVEKALALHPKVIIPIHDWHWKDEVRNAIYARLTTFFLRNHIDFRGIENGTSTVL